MYNNIAKIHPYTKVLLRSSWDETSQELGFSFCSGYKYFDELSPVVSVWDNFDALLIDENHPLRSKHSTYYLDNDNVLCTHTSAHQVDLLTKGHEQFIVIGDVYQCDFIDVFHYPIFHQIEGVKLCENPMVDLQNTLELIVKDLFPDLPFRYQDAYFSFTEHSLKIEVSRNDNWVEILGAGKIHSGVLKNADMDNREGWVFSMDLEKLAMLAFDIPDIRLFWTEDERFHNQFVDGKIVEFQPYSNYPTYYRGLSFFLSEKQVRAIGDIWNNLYEIIREEAGDLVENVKWINCFTNPVTQSELTFFNITYRSLERTLTDEEVNVVQERVRKNVAKKLSVSLGYYQ